MKMEAKGINYLNTVHELYTYPTLYIVLCTRGMMLHISIVYSLHSTQLTLAYSIFDGLVCALLLSLSLFTSTFTLIVLIVL
jgi:hypothetical protein